MPGWYVKNCGEAIFAEESMEKIKKLFREEYKKLDNPDDMAIFIRHESEGYLHCQVKIYFSPAAGIIASKVEAIPCARPSRDGLDVFAGSEGSWSLLF